MSIMADGHSYDATVTLCPRPLQLFQIQAFLLPQHLFFLLLPAQPTSTATTSIRATLSYCCHTTAINVLPAQQLQLFLLTFIASMATLQQSFCMIVATSTTLLVLPPCHPHPQEHPHAMNRSCSWNYPLICYHYQLSVSNFGLKTCTTPYSLISHSSPW